VNQFKGKLEPVPHGGLFVVVPAAVASKSQLAHGARVRGTVNGVEYRSSLMKYSGVFHMGVHKTTAGAAGLTRGARVVVTIEADRAPLPHDLAPDDLTGALSANVKATETWQKLAPAVRRGYVKSVIEAKRSETRARRISRIVQTLQSGVPARRTWTPPERRKRRRADRS
jgi:hypothetical protein